MIGVVPAAGKGTRLRPLTTDTPKGLVTVGERPLLAHVFDTLRDSGVSELIVVVGYRAGEIIDHFGESVGSCPITYVHQRERRGLGHAIHQTAPHIDEPFVVLNGDNVVAGDLSRPITRFKQNDADAVVAVEANPAAAGNTGVVTVSDESVTRITERPDDPQSNLVTTGCYVLGPAIFDALSLLSPSDRGEYELSEAVGVLVRAGATVGAVELESKRVNVNTPADRDRAEALLAETDG